MSREIVTSENREEYIAKKMGNDKEESNPHIIKHVEKFGSKKHLIREIYSHKKAPGSYLQLTSYPEEDGREAERVVNTTDIPEKYKGKGYGQELYLAALKDAPIKTRHEFASEDAKRVWKKLEEKGHISIDKRGVAKHIKK